MKRVLVKTHELWLEMQMGAFMAKDSESKRVLNEYSKILWRHFTWIEHNIIKNGIEYNYDRDVIPIKVDKLSVLLSDMVHRINDIEFLLVHIDDEALNYRLQRDLEYIKYSLANIEDEDITAFDMNRQYRDIELDEEARGALTLFLFEESYKEYELIMIYNYLQAHSDDAFLNRIFQILIDESFFHLRSFGEMMAEMGILGVPRVIYESLYKVSNLEKFLLDGIEEEIMAKEQCKELSDAVSTKSKELAKFFDFINYQENYHIELMREAVEYYREKNSNG